ncbi:MAG: hypothetical protein SFT92_00310 [Rickettsiales bacterium]|nr:hypothetical protein [Rickettsiales bacterium]
MVSTQDAGQNAHDATVNAGEQRVATFLESHWDGFKAILFGEHELKSKPTKAEFLQMARSAIDSPEGDRSITIPTSKGNVPVKFSKIKAKLEEFGQGSIDIDGLVPTRAQLNKLADGVSNGVKENVGGIGFLGGATIGNALQGLFKWLMSGFKGGFSGLKEKIAEYTASNMQTSIQNNLLNLRSTAPEMKGFLSDTTIAAITARAGNETMVQAGFAPNNPAAQESSNPAITLQINDKTRDAARNVIKHELLTPDGKAKLEEQIGKRLEDGIQKGLESNTWYQWGPTSWLAKAAAPGKDDAKETAQAMAPVIADTIATRLTDPNFRTKDGRSLSQLDRMEFTNVFRDEIGKELKANPKTKDNYFVQNHLDDLLFGIRGELAQNYDRMHQANTILNPDMQRAVAQAKDPNAPVGGAPAPGDAASPSAPRLPNQPAPQPGQGTGIGS